MLRLCMVKPPYIFVLTWQGSKVNDFFEKTEHMFEEMNWQKKLRSNRWWHCFARYSTLISVISFHLGEIWLGRGRYL